MARPQMEPTKIVSLRPMTPDLERKQAQMWRKILDATARAIEQLPADQRVAEDVDDGREVPGPYSVEKLTATHGHILRDGHAIPLTRYKATLENCRIAVNALNRIHQKNEKREDSTNVNSTNGR